MSRKSIYGESYMREPVVNPAVEQIKEKKEADKRVVELMQRLEEERKATKTVTRRLREAESVIQQLRH